MRIKVAQQGSKENAARGCLQPISKAPARTGPGGLAGELLGLQRTHGNRFVGRLLQTKLAMSQPGDPYEREADRVAEQVMHMAEPQAEAAATNLAPLRVQRMCACRGSLEGAEPCPECEQEARLRRAAQGTVSVETAPPIVHEALRSPGQPLDPATRAFFEPRFGQDFGQVRIHTGTRAAELASAMDAMAFTVGHDVVFGTRQFAPETEAGRHLLAHELIHVVQHDRGAAGESGSTANPMIRRQTFHTSCAGRLDDLRAAWDRAVAIVGATISTLETMRSAMYLEGGPAALMPRQTQCLLIGFGDVGGLGGGGWFTTIGTVIENFGRIRHGFSAGKNLRCDPQTVGTNECDWRSAFVVDGNNTDIFLCPAFFEPDASVTSRAVTLIHEMAHIVLRARHQGLPERTFPATFFDYSVPLGLDFDDAKKNAFAYEILANCLHGEPPSSVVEGRRPSGRAGEAGVPRDFRWSASLAGGVAAYSELQALTGLRSRFSIREGPLVIFNPIIGLNVLYGAPSDLTPQDFALAMIDLGLRIQQPVEGFYFDLNAGAYAGFEAPSAPEARGTAGFTAAVGLGWRWQRVEVGPEVRALFPFTSEDPTRVLVTGQVGVRF